jgi:hypothetical protein
MFLGKSQTILSVRGAIMRDTIKTRRLQHRGIAAL